MEEIYCKKCGNTAQPKDLFCRKCGSSLGTKTFTQEELKSKLIEPIKTSKPSIHPIDEPPFVNTKKAMTSLTNRRKPLDNPPSPLPPSQTVHSKKGDPEKRHSSSIGILLEVLFFFMIGMVVFRVNFALIEADQVQIIREQYKDYWSKLKDEKMSLINNINPTPLGLKGDGLFNEAFDDDIAVDSSGFTTIDAHNAIGASSDILNACLAHLFDHKLLLRDYQTFGPSFFQLWHPGISIPTQVDLDELRTQCMAFADKLVTLMFKAFVAQWLGFFDMLIGLNAVCLLFIGSFWLVRRQRSKITSSM